MRKIELKQQYRASIAVRLNAFGGDCDARSKRDRTSDHIQFVANLRLLRHASSQTRAAIASSITLAKPLSICPLCVR
jgi:hypothetical protein